MHRHQLLLLRRSKLVLNPNSHPDVQSFDLAFGVEHFVQLRERLLLVDGIRFHRVMERFHRVLQLPLQLVKARRGLLNLGAHESLLFRREIQFARVLHDHLWREHRVSQRIMGHQWRTLRRLALRRRPIVWLLGENRRRS